MEDYQLGGERVRMGGKVQRLRSIIGRYQIGDVKKSIGNGEAKELTCMTQGHEQGWGDCPREWACWVEGGNCNSRINTMELNKEY